MRRMLIAAAVLVSACGGGSKGPSSPSTPSIAQVGGLWRGTVTLTSVTGGECVGTALQAFVGTSFDYTLSITQAGSSLTATSTDLSDGTTCSWSGTAGANSLVLNATRCDAAVVIGIQCGNGALRDVQLTASVISVNVSGSSITGTYSDTANVFISGTGTGVGILNTSARINAARQ